MIERKFVSQNFKEFQIKKYVKESLSKVGLSGVKLQRTSLGERLVIKASRPGLVVGRGGSTIQKLTRDLKEKFHLENPQIEIEEVENFSLDAAVVAESIVGQLERFGTQRFKGVGHKVVGSVMGAGALGVEILISGKIPSSRSKTWRFADGYMKKCGDLAITGVDTAKDFAELKTGVVGVQVRIMPGTTVLPDQITFDKREREAKKQAALEQKEEAKKKAKEKREKKVAAKKSSEKETKDKEEKKKTDDKKVTKKKTTKKSSKEKNSSEEKPTESNKKEAQESDSKKASDDGQKTSKTEGEQK